MSMRVVFLKDHGDYKEGFQGFISRQLGRRLCQQMITIPWSEFKPKRKKPKLKPRKKAVSKKVETREKAITE